MTTSPGIKVEQQQVQLAPCDMVRSGRNTHREGYIVSSRLLVKSNGWPMQSDSTEAFHVITEENNIIVLMDPMQKKIVYTSR